ncbi:MAG: urease subunit gamma [Candidatus Kariarchaeaceae archaeon]|jgi:urease gamma subunit
MIKIKAIIKGEEDTPPFSKLFEYDTNYEKIFFNALKIIQTRLSQNLRININETLMLFCGLITQQLREGKSNSEIVDSLSKLLIPEKVLIGVPESLRKISFEVNIDDIPSKIISIVEPISITDYILTGKA